MTKWEYGESIKYFPISEGQIWGHNRSGSKVTVHDLRNPLPSFIKNVDMIYSDPPWNQGNVNSFVTKAGLTSYITDFDAFLDVIFNHITNIRPKVCYIEMGFQYVGDIERRLHKLYPVIQKWEICYGSKNTLSYLVRGGPVKADIDFTGYNDKDTPFIAVKYENPDTIYDLCTGRGTTMAAAHQYNKRFYGTELHPNRLAVGLERAYRSYGKKYENLS